MVEGRRCGGVNRANTPEVSATWATAQPAHGRGPATRSKRKGAAKDAKVMAELRGQRSCSGRAHCFSSSASASGSFSSSWGSPFRTHSQDDAKAPADVLTPQ